MSRVRKQGQQLDNAFAPSSGSKAVVAREKVPLKDRLQDHFHGRLDNAIWLLLDSRVVDLPMAHNPTFVTLSSLKPLFFNSLKNELRFSDNVGA